jgi:hypothetical protein
MAQKWEYKSIQLTKGFMGNILNTDVIDDQLNLLGEQGWELVNCFSVSHVPGESREVFGRFSQFSNDFLFLTT